MEREVVDAERLLPVNGFFKRISWSAVFAGVLIALITRHAADAAAKGASTAAILSALGLLLGAAVSGYAARMGTDSKDDFNRYDRPVGTV